MYHTVYVCVVYALCWFLVSLGEGLIRKYSQKTAQTEDNKD